MVSRLLLLLLITACSFSAHAGEEAITLVSRKGDIQGTLQMPENPGKGGTPIVLIIAGSGPTDRNGNLPGMTTNAYRLLADGLAAQGIASLRYDKRGIGESKAAGKSERDLRFEDYVLDAREWIRTLAGDRRFSNIVIAGHSEGSLIGMMAAAAEDGEVQGFISLEGAARPAYEVMKEQLAAQAKEMADMVSPMLDTLKNGDTLHNVPQMLYALFRPSVQPYMISWFKYDPQTEIKKLSMPILLVQGGTDIQVTVKDAVLLAAAQPKAQKLVVADMNHVLKQTTATTMQEQMAVYNNGELPLHPELMSGVVGFVKGLK